MIRYTLFVSCLISVLQGLAQENEKQIYDIIKNERKAYLEHNYDLWSSYWTNNDVSYLVTVDGLHFTTWDSLRLFIKEKMKTSSPNDPYELIISHVNYIIEGDYAYVSFIQNIHKPDLAPLFQDHKSFETRTLRRINGQWKIYALVNSTFYHEETPEMADLFLGRSAWILFQNGKINESIKVAEAHVNAFPQTLQSYGTLAFLYLQNNEKENALKTIEKALIIAPDNERFRQWYEDVKN